MKDYTENYAGAIKAAGMTICSIQEYTSSDIITADIMTKNGYFYINVDTNGTAWLDKPNGSKKMLYEKSPAQLLAILKKTIACNN